MLYLGTTPLAGNIKTKLFTSSGTFVIPSDVSVVWLDCCSGGAGGGGGDPTPGGGGGGGSASLTVFQVPVAVTPGETLTITIGAAGTGGAVGANGGLGGLTTVAGGFGVFRVSLSQHTGGRKGENPNGGDSGSLGFNMSSATGGAGGGGASIISGLGGASLAAHMISADNIRERSSCGSAGGALNFNSGFSVGFANIGDNYPYSVGTGNSSGGGGGIGGSCRYGRGGAGGSNGAAGSNATGYGAGGGGGSGNSAGGNGSPGFLRFYMITGYTI